MITTMEFTKGFIYKEVRYGWKNKKLFRLPFTRNKRSFGLKEIPFYVFLKKNTLYTWDFSRGMNFCYDNGCHTFGN